MGKMELSERDCIKFLVSTKIIDFFTHTHVHTCTQMNTITCITVIKTARACSLHSECKTLTFLENSWSLGCRIGVVRGSKDITSTFGLNYSVLGSWLMEDCIY
jgi:hypothetical protein